MSPDSLNFFLFVLYEQMFHQSEIIKESLIAVPTRLVLRLIHSKSVTLTEVHHILNIIVIPLKIL